MSALIVIAVAAVGLWVGFVTAVAIFRYALYVRRARRDGVPFERQDLP